MIVSAMQRSRLNLRCPGGKVAVNASFHQLCPNMAEHAFTWPSIRHLPGETFRARPSFVFRYDSRHRQALIFCPSRFLINTAMVLGQFNCSNILSCLPIRDWKIFNPCYPPAPKTRSTKFLENSEHETRMSLVVKYILSLLLLAPMPWHSCHWLNFKTP